MAERELEDAVLASFRRLNVRPLLTSTTDGVADIDVYWVTPQELKAAAIRLRQAVDEKHLDTEAMLEVYARNANEIDPVEDEFKQDLVDIEKIAEWAAELGAARVTLAVNW